MGGCTGAGVIVVAAAFSPALATLTGLVTFEAVASGEGCVLGASVVVDFPMGARYFWKSVLAEASEPWLVALTAQSFDPSRSYLRSCALHRARSPCAFLPPSLFVQAATQDRSSSLELGTRMRQLANCCARAIFLPFPSFAIIAFFFPIIVKLYCRHGKPSLLINWIVEAPVGKMEPFDAPSQFVDLRYATGSLALSLCTCI